MKRFILLAVLAGLVPACQRTHFQESLSVSPSEAPPSLNLVFKKATPARKTAEPSAPHREYILFLKAKKKKKINFLFALDVSASMDPYLTRIGRRLSPLLSAISDHDWWMAFTLAYTGYYSSNGYHYDGTKNIQDQWQNNLDESSPYFGKLMNLEGLQVPGTGGALKRQILKERILTSNTPRNREIFKNTVSHDDLDHQFLYPPYSHPGDEQPLRALKFAMERAAFDNDDFFRGDAEALVTFIVTNSDEREDDPERAVRAQEVKETFNTYIKPRGIKRFFHFNILVTDERCLQENGANEGIGTLIMELANITTGPEGNISICEEDFSPAFQRVSELIETLVERSVDIPAPFIPETFKVEFLSGSPLPYRLFGRRLIFEREPSEDTKIKISFSVPKP